MLYVFKGLSMSNNIIKIKTRKDDFERIYKRDEIRHFIPRTKKSSVVFDWIVSLFAFGSNPKYFVEFIPHNGDFNWRIAKVECVTRCKLSACPSYIRARYKREGYDLESVFYCIELAG